MTRVSAIVARYQGALVVVRVGENASALRTLLADRVANAEAFPGECVVRLPRRVTRAYRQIAGRGWSWWALARALTDQIGASHAWAGSVR